MEASRTLWMFVLLNQLLLDSTDADQGPVTTQTYSSRAGDQGGSPTSAAELYLSTADHHHSDDSINGTRVDCLIDTEMGLIAVGSAGGLIFCLLLATFVLACQLCLLQRRVYVPRTSRSDMDLVSGTDYWGTDQTESGGLVGPCDPDVMLEEVRVDSKMEEEKLADVTEEPEEAKAGREEETTAKSSDPVKDSQIKSSGSRDLGLEVPRDLEDMPLVV